MRILMLAEHLSHPSGPAGSDTTLSVLRCLAGEHQVALFAFASQQPAPTFHDELLTMCQQVHLVIKRPSRVQSALALASSMAQGNAYTLERVHAANMRAAVGRFLRTEQVDAIHLDHLSMAQFVPASWQRPIILDERRSLWRDVNSKARISHDPAQRWLLERDARLLRAAEAEVCRRATVTIAGNEMERAALEQALGAPWRIHIVPETVDLSMFEPLWQRRAPEPGKLLTLAPGADAATQQALTQFLSTVYPAVHRLHPLMTLDILTRAHLPAAVIHSADANVHRADENSTAFWPHAAVYLAPPLPNHQAQRGILGALAAGIPVVAHPAACDGLAVLEGEHLLMAQTPGDFAACIEWLAREVSHTHKLIMRGRRLIQERYDTAVAVAGLRAAYEHVAHAVNENLGINRMIGGSRCVFCS